MTINELVEKLDWLTRLQAGYKPVTQLQAGYKPVTSRLQAMPNHLAPRAHHLELVEISAGRWALEPRAQHLELAINAPQGPNPQGPKAEFDPLSKPMSEHHNAGNLS